MSQDEITVRFGYLSTPLAPEAEQLARLAQITFPRRHDKASYPIATLSKRPSFVLRSALQYIAGLSSFKGLVDRRRV